MKDSYNEGGEDENRMTDPTEIRNILESSQCEKVETEDIMDVSTAKTEVETETLREYSRCSETELPSDKELSDTDDSHKDSTEGHNVTKRSNEALSLSELKSQKIQEVRNLLMNQNGLVWPVH